MAWLSHLFGKKPADDDLAEAPSHEPGSPAAAAVSASAASASTAAPDRSEPPSQSRPVPPHQYLDVVRRDRATYFGVIPRDIVEIVKTYCAPRGRAVFLSSSLHTSVVESDDLRAAVAYGTSGPSYQVPFTSYANTEYAGVTASCALSSPNLMPRGSSGHGVAMITSPNNTYLDLGQSTDAEWQPFPKLTAHTRYNLQCDVLSGVMFCPGGHSSGSPVILHKTTDMLRSFETGFEVGPELLDVHVAHSLAIPRATERLYVIGGFTHTYATTEKVEYIDPHMIMSVAAPALPNPIQDHCSLSTLENVIYLARSHNSYLSLDVRQDRWHEIFDRHAVGVQSVQALLPIPESQDVLIFGTSNEMPAESDDDVPVIRKGRGRPRKAAVSRPLTLVLDVRASRTYALAASFPEPRRYNTFWSEQ